MGARDRARLDRANGDLGSARRRLMSLHDQQGYNPQLCREIGMLSVEMNDPVEAGRWLLISDLNSGTFHDAAIGMFMDSCSRERSVILQRLPRSFKRAEFEKLPGAVRARLNDVGIERLPGPTQQHPRMRPSKLLDRALELGCGLVLIFLLISTVVGLGTILNWLFD